MEFLRQLAQMFSAAIGSVVIMGLQLFESLLFGLPVWFIWNLFDVGGIVGIGLITYWQAVGVLFIYKALTFKSSDLSPKLPTQIVIPDGALKGKK